jgi:hypothetical protein
LYGDLHCDGYYLSIFAIGILTGCDGSTGAAGATGPAGPAGPAGPPGPVSTLGFASINLGDGPTGSCIPPAGVPCVYFMGGDGVTSVIVTQLTGVGDYEVRFFGSWAGFTPGESQRYRMTVLATVIEADGQYTAAPITFCGDTACAGAVVDATGLASEIFVRVQVWRTSDLAPADKDFSVAIFR